MTDENTTNSDNGNTDIWAKIHATLDRITERQEKTDAQMAETSRKMAETKELIAATSRQMAKTDEQMAKTDEQMAKTDEQMAKTDRKLSNLGSQCGDLGNKFGSFTEGLAMASIERIMEEDLDADYFGDYRSAKKKELGPLQIDAWGVSRNGTNTVYLVEVKSKFRSEYIQQVRNLVRKFLLYEEEFMNHRICPMIAAVDINDDQRLEIWKAGMQVIDAADGVFRLAERPDGSEGEDGPRRGVPNFRMVPGGRTDGNHSQHGS